MSWVRIPLVTPKEILDNQTIIEDFSFIWLFCFSGILTKKALIQLVFILCLRFVSELFQQKTGSKMLTFRAEIRKEEKNEKIELLE